MDGGDQYQTGWLLRSALCEIFCQRYSISWLISWWIIFPADEGTPFVGAGLIKILFSGKVGAYWTGAIVSGVDEAN